MEADQITEQKVLVLQYFIENESLLMAGYTPDKGVLYPDPDTHQPRFYTYPKRIEDDLKGKYSSISREWAGKICKDLEALGILGYHMIRAARQKHPTEHYFLQHGTAPFVAVMKIVLEKPAFPRGYISMSFEYIRQHINEELVREILAGKNVVMDRSLDLWDWTPVESRKVHDIYYARRRAIECGFGRDNSKDPYTPSYEACIEKMITKADGTGSFPHTLPWISLRFPVFKADETTENKIKLLLSENKQVFKEYLGLDQCQSAVWEHYEKFQRDHWILPILALIQSSRKALKEFLFGDWKPYESASGPTSMDYPIFSFLFTAVYDIATTRYVMNESTIPSFRFRPDFQHSPSAPTNPALLEIGTNLNLTICYDASFDTEHIFYGAENGDVWENDTEQNYEVRTWIEIRALGIRLKKENIRKFPRFIAALQDRSNPVSRRIVERLSHRMQHFILFSHTGENEFPMWGESLLTELDRIFSGPGLYDSNLFPHVSLTEDGKNLVERKGYYGRVDSDRFYCNAIFRFNRILFEESYPDLVNRSDYLKSDREQMIEGTIGG